MITNICSRSAESAETVRILYSSSDPPISRGGESRSHLLNGVVVIVHKYFGAIPVVDDATRKKMLEEVRTTIQKVVSEKAKK